MCLTTGARMLTKTVNRSGKYAAMSGTQAGVRGCGAHNGRHRAHRASFTADGRP
jgi:hypothetical protein